MPFITSFMAFIIGLVFLVLLLYVFINRIYEKEDFEDRDN